MAIKFKNAAKSKLLYSISSTDTKLTVLVGEGAHFPVLTGGDYFIVAIIANDGTTEYIKVTARTGDVLTVERGQEGSTAVAFLAGSRVNLRLTAAGLEELLNVTYADADEIAEGVAEFEAISPKGLKDSSIVMRKVIPSFILGTGWTYVGGNLQATSVATGNVATLSLPSSKHLIAFDLSGLSTDCVVTIGADTFSVKERSSIVVDGGSIDISVTDAGSALLGNFVVHEVPNQYLDYIKPAVLDNLGTASQKNVGVGLDDIPTNKLISTIAPQCIVKSPTGHMPYGWSSAECDAPVVSILADRILPHTNSYGQSGIASVSGSYSATYPAWKAVTGTALNGDDAWVSTEGTGISEVSPAWFRYDFQIPRSVGSTVTLTARNYPSAIANPKTFEIRGVRADDSEDVIGSYVNQPAATVGQLLTYAITPLAPYKSVYLHITGSNTSNLVAIGDFQIAFADVPAGHVGIPAGLQVSYADNGKVRLSEELASQLSVDMSSEPDGTKYVYVDMNADRAITNVGITDLRPVVSTSNVGQDLMPAFTSALLAGWGIVTASSNAGAGFEPFMAYDRNNGTIGVTASQWRAYGATDQWLNLAFERTRRLVGVAIGVTNYSANEAAVRGPERCDIQVNGVTLKSFRGKTWLQGEVYTVMFDSVVEADSLRLAGMQTNGVTTSYVGLADVRPLFARESDLYNPATMTMLNSADEPIHRVYIGSVVKFGGDVVAVNCYALGTSTLVPINNGLALGSGVSYSIASPFLPPYDSTLVAEMYSGVTRVSPVVGNYLGGAIRGWENLSNDLEDPIITKYTYSSSTNLHGVAWNLTRAALLVKRGY